jgi:hypothetical protein
VKFLQGLIDLINEHMANMEDGEDAMAVTSHYRNTLRHIKAKQQGQDGDRFRELRF